MNEHRPSKELVDRLRNSAIIEHPCSPGLARKAADEIERLQRHIAEQDQQMHQMGVCQTCAERDRATGEPPAAPTHVRLTKDIYDDGQDHHPPSYIARAGEVLEVRLVHAIDVGHPGTEGGFRVFAGEFEPASPPPPPDVHRRVAELYDAALCSITFNLSEPVSAKEAQRALDAAKEIK